MLSLAETGPSLECETAVIPPDQSRLESRLGAKGANERLLVGSVTPIGGARKYCR